MKNFLSQTEREYLKELHKKERDKRICYGINAVLLYDRGWTYQEIADALLLSDEAIKQHIQEYQSTQKLKPENGGSVSKLNTQQTELLLLHLQTHTYLTRKVLVQQDISLNAGSTITFFQKLESAYPGAGVIYLS